MNMLNWTMTKKKKKKSSKDYTQLDPLTMQKM